MCLPLRATPACVQQGLRSHTAKYKAMKKNLAVELEDSYRERRKPKESCMRKAREEEEEEVDHLDDEADVPICGASSWTASQHDCWSPCWENRCVWTSNSTHGFFVLCLSTGCWEDHPWNQEGKIRFT